MNGRTLFCIALIALLHLPRLAHAQVVISEIMYHPVERPAFDSNGVPLLDLSHDVHEFLELHNTNASAVNLAGWRLAGGISFDFPASVTVASGGFLVIAKDPVRLAALSQYGLTTNQILGPYSGQLDNDGDTLRLRDAADNVVDSISYSSAFPWAISANSLGAEDEWTGLNSYDFQYRGRSLERVSFTHPANDPANWLASPLATGPTPGRANSLPLAVPRPVVVSLSAGQASDGATIIRSNQQVRLDVTFSATNQLANVSVEYFVDDINLTNETRSTVALTPLASPSDGRYTATLPARPNRNVVRYRLRADRGAGVETVSPRADDPFAWHAYFVTPTRTSANSMYDCFISSASLNTLSTNISQGPRRVTLPDPPGNPRASWNDTEPATLVFNGEVFDIQMRHHGSRYNRNPVRNSLKWQFPRYHRFVNGQESLFITDKGEEHRVGAQLYDAADFPAWRCRYVDLFLNTSGSLQRLQQDEMDETLYQRWAQEQAAKYPGRPVENLGGIFKATGVIPFETGTGQNTAPYETSGEGPYYIGNTTVPPAKPGWTTRQRCEWTYGPQINGWKGGGDVEELLKGLWAARGDSPLAPSPNLGALRPFLEANFDVDRTLTYMAIRDWSGPFDNATHNYFLWRLGDGRWSMLPWDLDSEFDTPPQTIFWDEYVNPQPDPLRGPHWVKDSFYKTFRNEYKQKLWLLNNTLLNPTNFPANGWTSLQGFANQRLGNVNQQLGLGVFHRPVRPAPVAPTNGVGAVPPAALQASPYTHSNPSNPPPHASTTWLIRRSTGGYTNPVARVTSTTNLTSLPIPFDDLAFGQTYFWKCFYTDAQGHPSLESAEASFIFGAAPVPVTLVPINAGTLWRYNAAGTNPPANWNQPGFDDSAWPQGAPLLADETGPLPEPIRTTLVRSNYVSFYFRHSFVFPGDTAGVTLRLRQVVDDGVVVYLNGVEVSRSGLPGGAITFTTPANRTVGDAVYEGPLSISSAALLTGTNWLAAEVHQASVQGNDIVFGLVLEAGVPPSPGSARLNEILADNRGSVTNGPYAPDFIELHNTSGLPQDLAQMSLSDNPERPGKFIFPPNTVIAPGGFLTLWCDDATNAPGLHTGFALDNDGQTVALFAVTTNGYQLSDVVTFGLQVPDKTIGRVGIGAGLIWLLCDPTINATNTAAALGSTSSLKVNEWMATDTTGPDWFELFNPESLPVALGGLYLSDSASTVTNTRIAALSFIPPRGYRQFIADEDPGQNARHVNFKLSASGESILVANTDRTVIDTVAFGAQVADVSQGRLPDGSSNIVSFAGSASPEAPNHLPITGVVFNELVPDLELHNIGPAAMNVGGWWLSDDPAMPQKYRIPDDTLDTLILPGGYWWVDDDELPFNLRAVPGGQVILSHDGLYRLGQRFGPYDNHPYGRTPTSLGVDFVRLSAGSFGATNAPPEVGPIVLSEIQYHPPDLPGDDDDYEFVELANLSGAPVNLFDPAYPQNCWRLRDAVSFTFATNTTLTSGERVLVLGFDPATNVVALSNFLAVYDVPPGIRLFGPYSGKLDNAGDSVELVKPGQPISIPGPDYGAVPAILMDRVNYRDAVPWPPGADGIGPSLQRRTLSAYGNEPTNWFASGVSPGGASSSNTLPTVAISAPANGSSSSFGLPVTLTANAADSDGFVRLVEFFADGAKLGQASRLSSEPPNLPFLVTWTNASVGPHTLSARATDNRLGVTVSAPVTLTVVNQAPTVALVTPTNGAAFLLPTNIVLEATAHDSDGAIVKVEFFSDSSRLGEDTSSPYAYLWTNVPSGSHSLTARATDNAGGMTISTPVTISATRTSYIAYIVNAGTIGTQNFPNGLGMDFDVTADLVVSRLGVFDSNGDGINGATVLTTQLYTRSGNSGTLLATLTFNAASPGTLMGGSRFKFLPTALLLRPGSYTIASYGHDGGNQNGNLGTGNLKTWSTDGGGLITFTGTSRFGSAGAGSFPGSPDGGPVDRYAAGTFEFRPVPAVPVLLASPTNFAARVGANATNSVVVAGNPPLRYQWFFNGAALASATNAFLVLTNVQLSHAGDYSVVVTNAAGSVTSAPARLTLLIDPEIVQALLSQTVVTGATVTLSVTVNDTATLPVGYRWRTNNAFVPNAFFTLNQRTCFFTVTNARPPFTNYAVVVTNQSKPGGNLSTSAILTFVADGDGDGLPDEWESLFGLDPMSAADAASDRDHDGMANWQEYVAGTDPSNASSYLKINALAGAGATLSFGAVANKTYTVQYTDRLFGQAWSKLSDVPAGALNRTEVLMDPGYTTNRFYRVATPQQP